MKRLSAYAFLGLALVAGCGIENALVGGHCAAGKVLENDLCVDLTGNSPPEVPTTDSTPASPDSGAVTDASVATDSSKKDSALPFTETVQPPLPVEVDSGADADVDMMCTPPLVLCRGKCISVDGDPMNCGACGKQCPSNICVMGECQGATPGDVVLIGHDYTNALSGSAQTKVLVNTMSIPTTDPIRVLSFETGADPAAVAQLKYLATTGISRKIKYTVAPSASWLASTTLTKNYDIVIINDASAVNPATVGPTWAAPLNTFAMKGGVVLAIDTGASPMPALLTNAGLLTMSGHTVLPDMSHLLVTSAADVIGAGVLSPYAAFGTPVSFQGMTPEGNDMSWVVQVQQSDGTAGDPVVVHRTVR